MSSKSFVIKPADRKTALDVMGMQITVLVSGADSKDQRVTLQSGDEGMGPPPHSHDWDESFFVSKGQIQFTCGGEMIEMTGQRSNAIEMFAALAREIPPGPPDFPKAIQVLGEHGVKVHL